MSLTMDQLSGLALIAFGVIIGVQGFISRRRKAEMLTRWPQSHGVITEARPEIVTDNDGTSWSLHLQVEANSQRVVPRALLAQSDDGLEALSAAYPVGRNVSLRRDPRHGTFWIDDQTPDTGGGWLLTTAAALVLLGLLAGAGVHRSLLGLGA